LNRKTGKITQTSGANSEHKNSEIERFLTLNKSKDYIIVSQ